MIKISLIDEDSILMERIADFLMIEGNHIVISKNADFAQFLKNPPVSVDVIITNLLPDYLEKFNPFKSLKKEFPEAKILVLTHHEYANKTYEALKLGADGFCLKSDSLEDLESGITSLLTLGNYVSNAAVPFMINSFRSKEKFEGNDILTEKEKQIVKAICQGHSYKMIANETSLSIDGVRYYLQRIYRKLEINSKGELISIVLS
jgi:DNA-binding NarL/FixJ family response regulator